MSNIAAGTTQSSPVPDFSLPSTGSSPFKLYPLQSKSLVIYFYPKDNTPGCTTEAQQFRDLHAQFLAADSTIVGISRDSIKSHEGFKSKFTLPFELLSDADELACQLFGVIKMKKMYGKDVRGIERSTFVLDRNGHIRKEWRGLKADGHAQEVLSFVQSL